VRRLILVRHGETDWNVVHRFQGNSDVPLNDKGRAQARASAPKLARTASVKTIISSDLSRAFETAQIIASAMGAEVVPDARLQERCYGVWEGMLDEVLHTEYREERARYERGLEPGVEGFEGSASVVTRALEVVAERASAEGTHVLVAHGTTIRLLICSLLGLEVNSRAIGTLGNARWAALENAAEDNVGGHWVLRQLNAVGDAGAA
jgi:broad specificity phosphatase PhoE